MTNPVQDYPTKVIPVEVPILGGNFTFHIEVDAGAVITQVGNEIFVNGISLNQELIEIFSVGFNEELVQKCNAIFRLFSKKG